MWRAGIHRTVSRFGRPTEELPIAVLRAQDTSRVIELVPIRYGRMAVSPFTFFRGAAAVMAADLAGTPVSGHVVQLCGDAHLSNFGFFASPERRLVFDLNDFDETLPGPWEWDVKRLAVSVEIAGRDRGFGDGDRTAAVRAVGRGYRRAMRRFAEMTTLEVWYVQADVDELRARHLEDVGRSRRKRVDRTFAKARTRDNLGALDRFTNLVDGMPRFTPDPPVVMPLRDLLPDTAERTDLENQLSRLLRGYHDTLPADRRALLDQYRPVDMARKVVGVGSVSTRSWMILLLCRDDHDALVLQAKEAEPSVLEEHLGRAEQDNHGERVVVGQQLMQAVSDIFLGRMRVAGIDSAERDFYIRQLRDWKGSFEIEEMGASRSLLVRRPLRVDPRPGPRPVRGPHRDRGLPGRTRGPGHPPATVRGGGGGSSGTDGADGSLFRTIEVTGSTGGRGAMLSHEDHRRLAAIEQQLLIDDPRFVRRLNYRSVARGSRWRKATAAVVGVLCALAMAVGMLSGSGTLTLSSAVLTGAAWWIFYRARRFRH